MTAIAILIGLAVGVVTVLSVEPWTDKWFSLGASILVAFLVSVAVHSVLT